MEEKYTILFVEFETGGKSYTYISNGEEIKIGDFVKVPTSSGESVASVVDIQLLTAKEASFPLDKTKTIIGKYEVKDVAIEFTDNTQLKVDLHNALEQILPIVNENEYPETYHWIEEMLAMDIDDMDAMKVANTLLGSDTDVDMQPQVAQFVASLYKLEMDNKIPMAFIKMGNMYEDGRGTDADINRAIEYYKQAADLGEYDACNVLGYIYYYGKAGKVDDELAHKYFSLGAALGSVSCMYKLGDMYQSGRHIEKNEKLAFQFYVHAHQMLDEDNETDCAGPVCLRMGDAFFYGFGVEANLNNALDLYQRAICHLIGMVKSGLTWYKPSLKRAIEGERKTTSMLMKYIDEETK